MLPAQMKDFAKARAREEQQTQSCNSRTEPSIALKFAKGFSEPGQLFRRQEAFATGFGKALDPAAGLYPSGTRPCRSPNEYMLATTASRRFA